MLARLPNKKLLVGQTMLEIVLAIGISFIVLSAISVLSVASTKLSKISLHSAQGAKLASSGIEAIRYVRDVCGYDQLADGCYEINVTSGDVCGVVKLLPANSCDVNYSYEGEDYTRKITVESYNNMPNTKLVKSVVTWKQYTGTSRDKSIKFSALLSKRNL